MAVDSNFLVYFEVFVLCDFTYLSFVVKLMYQFNLKINFIEIDAFTNLVTIKLTLAETQQAE